jgi:head-tail adaptor
MAEYRRRKARGERRHLVTVQTAGVPVEDPTTGEYDTSYTDLAQMWASIEGPPREDEAVAGNVERAAVTHKVEMDYHAGINRRSRIVLEDGRILHVRGIVDLEERHVTLVIMAEELPATEEA